MLQVQILYQKITRQHFYTKYVYIIYMYTPIYDILFALFTYLNNSVERVTA